MDQFDLDWDLDINFSNLIGQTRSSNVKRSVGFIEKSNQTSRKRKAKKTSIDIIRSLDSNQDDETEEEIIKSKLEKLKDISHSRDPSSNMIDLIKILGERKYGFPNPGDIFTFIYRAKTPKIIYDEHPVSSISTLDANGFTGYNYHLNMIRRYSNDGGRIMSNFYKILPEELDLVLSINTKLIKRT